MNSVIIDFFNKILVKIHEKTELLTENSYILSNVDNILFFFICISLVTSIFTGNSYTALLLCIVALLFGFMLLLKKEVLLGFNKSTFCLFLYFLTAIISTVNSTMPHQSLTGLSKTVLYLLFFIAVTNYLKFHREKIRFLVSLIALCVSFEIVVAFIQNYTDVLSIATWQDTSRTNPELVLTRVFGTLKPSNPNLLGGYLVAATPFVWLASALNFEEKNKAKFLFFTFFSVLTIPAIFMTGCRGAYLALFVMLCVLAVTVYQICKFHYPEIYEFINKKKNAVIGFIALAITLVMVCIPKISHRILSIFAMRNDSSTSFRMNVYHSSWQMFHDNFWLGIGCGNKVFREVYGLYMLSGYDALSAYSVYLETAVENGIIGLIFYLLFIFYLIKNGLHAFTANNDLNSRRILSAGLISVAGVLVHGFFDTIYFRPQVQLIFWTSVALMLIYSGKQTETK